ncbi:MAG: apolipoprotein N-acyltransferase [Alphaproteobacteria bacterium]
MKIIFRFAEFVKATRGGGITLIAVVMGALSALAFAPFDAFPLLLLGLAVLVLLLDATARTDWKRAALIGWGFGFGQFLVGLHWVGYAFLINPDTHGRLIPFVAALLPGGLALFPMLVSLLYVRLRPNGVARIFLFAFLYGAAEFARGHILTGFPWNIPAYSWGALWGVVQSTAFIGAYGLSLLTLLIGASLVLLAERKPLLPAAMTILFTALWAGGEARLAYADAGTVPGVRLRIVQANVPQNEKYVQRYLLRNWQRLLELSGRPAARRPTHLIWTEAAPPFVLAREPVALREIGGILSRRTTLLTGAVRVERNPDGTQAPYNSFYVFAPDGRLADTYDKFHLVPFGEYLPFQSFMDGIGLTKVTGGPGGFAAGPGPRTIAVPGAPAAGPLICYEVIFPREVTGNPRPQLLINVTDVSWFGPAAGPRQHLLIARVRAVEEGLPIARAASTGISAVIDAYGRMRAYLPLDAQGALDAALPVALRETFFARYGALAIFLLFMFLGAASLVPSRHLRT